MLEANTEATIGMDAGGVARIRLRQDGIEAYSEGGGKVRLQDKTGRMIACVGVAPLSTRFLSVKGLERGVYKVELESSCGFVTSATIEA